ncbi:MAG: metallophosphoesterase [Sandaracinaceae bacterium]
MRNESTPAPVAWAAMLALLALAPGCGPREGAPPGPTTPASAPPARESSASSPLDALDDPPPFTPEELQVEIERFRSDLEGTALLARPAREPEGALRSTGGRALIDEDPVGRLVSTRELEARLYVNEPDADAGAGARATVNRRLFQVEPMATIAADGTLTVRFRTARPCPGASVTYGVALPQDPFARARLRREAGPMTSEGDEHRIAFDVRALLRERYDVAGARAAGRGEVRWRLQALDPERGTSRVFDGRTAFRCEGDGCTESSTLVQLPTVRLGPFVDRVSATGAIVSFDTDAQTVARVLVRGEGGARTRHDSLDPGDRHEVRVDGLAPAARQRYAVLVADRRGEVAVGRSAPFATPPLPGEDRAVRFAVLSDSRSGHGSPDEQYAGTNRAVLEDLLLLSVAEGSRFAVFVGDLVDGYLTHGGSFRYELEAWQRSVEPVGALMPIVEVFGNHEALMDYWDVGWAVDRAGAGSAEAAFAERFVNPVNGPEPEDGAPPYAENVFSFDAGPAHLAAINSNYHWRSHAHRTDHPAYPRGYREGWVDDRQIAWLDADLAAARARGQRHLFVFTHEPGFPNGGHVQDGMWWNGAFEDVIEQRRRLFTVLARHGVAAIIHGDEHNYSRTRIHDGLVEGLERPLWQIISGGAGAPYYARDEDVPWADDVRVFDARQHLVIVSVQGERATARVLARSGETIDRFDLTRVE